MRRPLSIACALALGAILAACGGGNRGAPEANASAAPEQSPAATPAPETPPAEAAASPSPQAGPLAKTTVTIYFPSATGDGLTPETREIVDVKGAADRGAQIVAALLEGPLSDAALPAVPSGTTLRRLWVRDDGSAYADFSEELASGSDTASADEIQTVYSIVDSLTSNVPGITKVGILVAGRERESLGHLDLRRPLLPDPTLVPLAKAAE